MNTLKRDMEVFFKPNFYKNIASEIKNILGRINSMLDTAEGNMTLKTQEQKPFKIKQGKKPKRTKQRKKRKKEQKNNLKQPQICVIRVPEVESERRKIFEEIMAPKFPYSKL